MVENFAWGKEKHVKPLEIKPIEYEFHKIFTEHTTARRVSDTPDDERYYQKLAEMADDSGIERDSPEFKLLADRIEKQINRLPVKLQNSAWMRYMDMGMNDASFKAYQNYEKELEPLVQVCEDIDDLINAAPDQANRNRLFEIFSKLNQAETPYSQYLQQYINLRDHGDFVVDAKGNPRVIDIPEQVSSEQIDPADISSADNISDPDLANAVRHAEDISKTHRKTDRIIHELDEPVVIARLAEEIKNDINHLPHKVQDAKWAQYTKLANTNAKSEAYQDLHEELSALAEVNDKIEDYISGNNKTGVKGHPYKIQQKLRERYDNNIGFNSPVEAYEDFYNYLIDRKFKLDSKGELIGETDSIEKIQENIEENLNILRPDVQRLKKNEYLELSTSKEIAQVYQKISEFINNNSKNNILDNAYIVGQKLWEEFDQQVPANAPLDEYVKFYDHLVNYKFDLNNGGELIEMPFDAIPETKVMIADTLSKFPNPIRINLQNKFDDFKKSATSAGQYVDFCDSLKTCLDIQEQIADRQQNTKPKLDDNLQNLLQEKFNQLVVADPSQQTYQEYNQYLKDRLDYCRKISDYISGPEENLPEKLRNALREKFNTLIAGNDTEETFANFYKYLQANKFELDANGQLVEKVSYEKISDVKTKIEEELKNYPDQAGYQARYDDMLTFGATADAYQKLYEELRQTSKISEQIKEYIGGEAISTATNRNEIQAIRQLLEQKFKQIMTVDSPFKAYQDYYQYLQDHNFKLDSQGALRTSAKLKEYQSFQKEISQIASLTAKIHERITRLSSKDNQAFPYEVQKYLLAKFDNEISHDAPIKAYEDFYRFLEEKTFETDSNGQVLEKDRQEKDVNVMVNRQTEKLFRQVKDIKELEQAIAEGVGLEDEKNNYRPAELISMANDYIDGKIDLDDVTTAGGFQNKLKSIRQTMEKNLDERIVAQASDFEGLYKIIQNSSALPKNKPPYDSADLIAIIEDVRNYKEKIEVIPTARNLRDQVQKLLALPEPKIKIFKKTVMNGKDKEVWQIQKTLNPDMNRINRGTGDGWKSYTADEMDELFKSFQSPRITVKDAEIPRSSQPETTQRVQKPAEQAVVKTSLFDEPSNIKTRQPIRQSAPVISSDQQSTEAVQTETKVAEEPLKKDQQAQDEQPIEKTEARAEEKKLSKQEESMQKINGFIEKMPVSYKKYWQAKADELENETDIKKLTNFAKDMRRIAEYCEDITDFINTYSKGDKVMKKLLNQKFKRDIKPSSYPNIFDNYLDELKKTTFTVTKNNKLQASEEFIATTKKRNKVQ